MSLYALTAAGLQGIRREHWERQVRLPDGTMHSVGLQEFVDELIARLSSTDPIQLADTLRLIPPANGPAIVIMDPDGDVEVDPPPGETTSFEVLSDVSAEAEGQVTVNGCDVSLSVTITLTKTFKTITLTNGVVTGIS